MSVFQIISEVGMAKSLLMESLACSREGDYNAAEEKIKEAEDYIIKGEESHLVLISKEANGNSVPISMLLMHAEDQLMTTLLLKDLAKEFILLYKKIN